ncbi:MAG: ABC transporter ATP-binding protein [Chlorobi bacterium]|nr:ABC transporter ATP-binding protein [Chlorobiota bacterium]
MSEILLDIRGLKTGYGTHTVLDGISARLRRGGLYALLGPNGSGKTTLIKTLAGMHPYGEGEIRLSGRELRQIPREERGKRMAVVFTRPITTPLTVFEILASGRFPYLNRLNILKSEDKNRILAVAERLDLISWMDRPITSLSDGERRRVMIGRALVQDAPLMLLDEPCIHLDIARRAEVLGLLRLIADEGKTVLFSTHYLDLYRRFSDEILLLHRGRLWQGPAEEAETKGLMQHIFGSPLLEWDARCGMFRLKHEGEF